MDSLFFNRFREEIKMKNVIGFTMMAVALMACGEKEEKAVAQEAKAESTIPADCQSYIDAVEKLVAKAPEAAKQFQQALESSKAQWATLTGEQADAANKACQQMLEQIKPML